MAKNNYWLMAAMAAGALALAGCDTGDEGMVATEPGVNTAEAPVYEEPVMPPGEATDVEPDMTGPGAEVVDPNAPMTMDQEPEGAVVGTAPPGGQPATTQPSP